MQVYKTSQGNWQVNFSEQGRQKTLYLGRDFTSGSADRVARIVTDILSCRNRGDSLPLEIFRQVESLPVRVQRSFERLGLIGGVTVWTLEKLLQAFYEIKSHLKRETQEVYKMFGNLLLQFFGKDKKISSVGKLDCERFKIQLLTRYSECTVSRGIRSCRSIFKFAVDMELLSKNPFVGVSGNMEVNLSRQLYVDREMIERVMEHCRDDYDRLLLALARFGGLRIPSEICHLRFCDFAGSVIQIHRDTKTGAREVPLFGEIREIFDRVHAQAGLRENFSPAAIIFSNLGNYWFRIASAITASGVERWVKLFVNLRSSCITDMVERGYTEKTLDAIFGNSAAIRSLHYVQFRKEKEYAKVLADDARMLEKLRTGVDVSALSLSDTDDLLVLRDLLVSRFGTGKKAG